MKLDGFRRTDRLFAGLLLVEWLAAIIVAVTVSPLTWTGEKAGRTSTSGRRSSWVVRSSACRWPWRDPVG